MKHQQSGHDADKESGGLKPVSILHFGDTSLGVYAGLISRMINIVVIIVIQALLYLLGRSGCEPKAQES